MSHAAAVEEFLETAEIAMPRGKAITISRGAVAERPPVVFTDAPQAVTAGSQMIGFDDTVPADVRAAITNSMLLAQTTANKKVPAGPVDAWYSAYLTALGQLGWLTSGVTDTLQSFDSDSFEVSKAIIGFIEAAVPGLGTAKLIIAALEALKTMAADEPWITLFDEYSRQSHYSSFQVAFGSMKSGQPSINLFCFVLDTDVQQTQVLFFKFGNTHASLRQKNGTVSIEPAALLRGAAPIEAFFAKNQLDAIAEMTRPSNG